MLAEFRISSKYRRVPAGETAFECIAERRVKRRQIARLAQALAVGRIGDHQPGFFHRLAGRKFPLTHMDKIRESGADDVVLGGADGACVVIVTVDRREVLQSGLAALVCLCKQGGPHGGIVLRPF